MKTITVSREFLLVSNANPCIVCWNPCITHTFITNPTSQRLDIQIGPGRAIDLLFCECVESICHDSSKVCWSGEPCLRTNVCHLSRFFEGMLIHICHLSRFLEGILIWRNPTLGETAVICHDSSNVRWFWESLFPEFVGAGPIPLKFGKQQFFMNPRR